MSAAARAAFSAFAVGVACGAVAAPGDDPLAWLTRAVQAARTTTFAGTFVHTNGDRTSTVRITHAVRGSEEHERVEPLDAPAYEIVRRNDEMYCYFPDAKTVKLDRRTTARFFPSLFAAPVATIAASYDVKLGATEHVLGYDCRWIRLDPHDTMRYAQRFCSETTTGLVLRAKTLSEQQQVIEQYTFTDLKVGPGAARVDLRQIFEARVKRWISDAKPLDEAQSAQTGWSVSQPPAGFEKITELKRPLAARAQPVSQIVFSDGLASLSVFVEPNSPQPRSAEVSSENGTTSFFVHPVGQYVVTVLGEVPLATAQQVARSVVHKP